MKKNILLSILLLAFCTAPLTASKGWYWDYVILNVNNSSNNYYWFGGNPKVYTQFDKTNLGTVTNLEIAGCDMRYWSSSKDRTGGSFFYKIMSQDGKTEVVPPVETKWTQAGPRGNDFQGIKKGSPIDLLAGLAYNTSFQLHMWAKTTGSIEGDSLLYNGGVGNPYIMYFTKYDAEPVKVYGANGIVDGTSYPTLQRAFEAISNNYDQSGKNITVTISGSTNENGPATLYSRQWNSLKVYPTSSGVAIRGNVSYSSLINLYGSRNVTFDGRVNASGTAIDMTIENTSTDARASTIAFSQSAQQNTINYCNIKGASTGMGGTIFFNEESSWSGNNSNEIAHNLITNSGGNRPAFSIVSGVRTNSVPTNVKADPNISNTASSAQKIVSPSNNDKSVDFTNNISNNEFRDFLNPSIESGAIFIQEPSTATPPTKWIISGNSFYETTELETSSNYSFAIKFGTLNNQADTPEIDFERADTPGIDFERIQDVNINNNKDFTHNISNNYIGGSAVNCEGKPWTMKSNVAHEFTAIALDLDVESIASVQNNTIQNMSITNNNSAVWKGIDIISGYVNVGTEGGNIIGSEVNSNSILLTGMSGVQEIIAAVKRQVPSSVQNITGTSKTTPQEYSPISENNSHSIYGIKSLSSDSVTIANNIIAGISNTSSTTKLFVGNICGIYTLNGSANISNNKIHNFISESTGNNCHRNGVAMGIYSSNDLSREITGNSIYNIAGKTVSIIGLLAGWIHGESFVSHNSIYNLSLNIFSECTNPTLSGLEFYGDTGSSIISNNFVSSLSMSDEYNTVTGISVQSLAGGNGEITCSNNIVSIGVGSTSYVYGMKIWALGGLIKTYFNTVYINGEGTSDSYALLGILINNTDIRNNIFTNVRSTSSGAKGKNYAAELYTYNGDPASPKLGNNLYYAPGTSGVLASNGRSDINQLPLISGKDVGSINTNPLFRNAGSNNPEDYQVGLDLVGDSYLDIKTDYEDNWRNNPPTIGALERNVNNWKGSISTDWNEAGNWTANVVPASNTDITFDKTPLRHCILDQNRTVRSIVNSSNVYQLLTNGNKLTITGNLELTNSAKIDASSANSIIEFAGTNSQIIPTEAFVNNQVYNLEINNPENVFLNDSLNLLNTITSTSGKLDAISNSPTVSYSGTTIQSIDGNPYLDNKVYNLMIDNPVEVSLASDITVDHLLTINEGKRLVIPTEKQLNVAGTIKNNAGVEGIVIKASPTGEVPNGTLIFHNTQTPETYVPATVEMYTKAFYDPIGYGGYHYKWQFFGIPLRTIQASPTFDGSYVRESIESGDDTDENYLWKELGNSDILTSFSGYEINQAVPKTIYFQGDLENKDYSSGKLAYTPEASYPGDHLIGNPYTAAIDINKIVFGSSDSTIVDNTVYLYNTGTYTEWEANGDSGTVSGNLAGQYLAIPLHNAGIGGLPSQIPSMQAFLIKVKSDNEAATISIPYSATSTVVKNTELQRAPSKNSAAKRIYTVIDVKGSRYSDHAWIFSQQGCSHGFDNGWDGRKSIDKSLAPKLFSMEKDGNYQVNTVDDINQTELGFQAGEDTQYTLTFTQNNTASNYKAIYLIDLLENKTIDVTNNGATYSFVVQPSNKPVKRFKLVTEL